MSRSAPPSRKSRSARPRPRAQAADSILSSFAFSPAPKRRRRRAPHFRHESLEPRRLLHGAEDEPNHALGDHVHAQLMIVVNHDVVDIPANVGVGTGLIAPIHTHDTSGRLHLEPLESTYQLTPASRFPNVGDFFEVWRTHGGAAGNNASAIFTSANLMGNVADATHEVRMYVDGRRDFEFQNHIIDHGESIVLVYTEKTSPESVDLLRFETNVATFDMELYREVTPITVENFETYAGFGDYDGTIIHRSVPGFVIQGGGYLPNGQHIQQDDPIQNEFQISNLVNTVAMAKLPAPEDGGPPNGGPDSATSEWFVNLGNNASNLDDQNGGFTVFGRVLTPDAEPSLVNSVVGAIAALPRVGTKPVLDTVTNAPVLVQSVLPVLGEIEGHVFLDLNRNGVQDTGEAGQSGWTVYVDDNNNGVLDSGEISAVTNTTGDFSLADLAPGDNVVRIQPRSGFGVVQPASASRTVMVHGSEIVTGQNFGVVAQSGVPSGVDLAALFDSGFSPSDNITNVTAPQFIVSGVTSGATVRLYDGTTQIGQATASGATVTIVTAFPLSGGVHNVSASQTLSGGLESDRSSPFAVTIDTTAPGDITPAPPAQAIVGAPYVYNAGNAEEGSGLRYSLTNPPAGMSINQDTGEITWSPAQNQAGNVSFTLVATDVAGNTKSVPVSVNVLASVPANPDSYSVAEDGALTVPVAQGVRINDGDTQSPPGTLTVSLVNNVGQGSLTLNADGSFTYTPAANFSGADRFTYRASDGTRTSAETSVTINVTPVNDPPVAVNDAYAATSGQLLSVSAGAGVLDNDLDIDSQDLTATLGTGPAHGTLTLSPDGSFSYTSTAGFSGTDTFTYTVSDGATPSNTATVTIAVNNAPVAVADAFGVDEDATLTIPAGAGVLSNDTDSENDALTAEVVAQPAHGTLTLAANGSFSYRPAENFSGTDTFTYRARDAANSSAPATVTLTVNAVNDAPTAAADTYRVDRDGTLTVGVSNGVLANDNDIESSPMTAAVVDAPDHGTLTLNPDGSFTYTPTAGFTGPDTFTYRASDGTLASSPATVTINVNSAPTAVGDTYQATEDQPLVVAVATGVLANDTDAENDALTAEVVTQPAHGTLTLNANGSFTYSPASNFTGSDSFTYQTRDGSLASASATVTINVQNVNDAPTAIADAYQVDEDASLSVAAIDRILANDTDVDSVTLTAQLVIPPQHGSLTLNADGTFTYLPSTNFNGTDTFTYSARDGALASTPATVTITVRPTNDPPVFTTLPFGTLPVFNLISGEVARLVNTAQDLDATTTVHYSLVSGPEGATVNSTTGQFRWDVPQDTQGRFLVTIRATENDAAALSTDATFAIDVTPVSTLLAGRETPRRPGFGDTRDRLLDTRAGGLRVGTITRTPSLNLGVIGQERSNAFGRIQGSGDIRLRLEKERRQRRARRSDESEPSTTTPTGTVNPASTDSTGSGASVNRDDTQKTSAVTSPANAGGWSEEALAELEFSPGDVAALRLTSFMLPAWSANETTATAISLLKHLEIDELLDSAQFAALAQSVVEILKNPPAKETTVKAANGRAASNSAQRDALRHALHAAALAATSFMPLLVTQLNCRQKSKHARLRAFLERLGN